MRHLASISGAFLLAFTQADSEKNYPNVLAPLYEFGRRGSEEGALSQPSAVAVGKDDLLYVADTGNHRIQTFVMNGKFRGSFGRRGTGAAEFLFPSAMAISAEGELYVADLGGRLQAFSAEGRFLKSWEGLRSPRGLAVSGDRIYVAEGDTNQIRVFSRKDGGSRVFGGVGSAPGRFFSPAGIAVDEDGAVYVADSGNHRIQKLDPEGKPLAQWGAWGAQAGLLSYPAGLAYSGGRLSVADRGNHRILVFDRQGGLIRQWGAPPPLQGNGKGRLHFPEGLAISPSGGLTVVCEPFDQRLQVFVNRDVAKTERVNDLPWWDSVHARFHMIRLAPPPPGCKPQVPGALGSPDVHAVFFFDVSGSALGPLASAGGYGRKLGELNGVAGVAVDPDRGRATVSDRGNRRLVLFEIPRDPQRRELFGGPIRVVGAHAMDRLVPASTPGYSSESAVPGPLCRDARGRLYILDRANAAIVVCESDFKFVRVIPVPPSLQEFAVAPDGTLYASDPVRGLVTRMDAEGRAQTSWGEFRMPWGVAVDEQGFVYVSDALDDVVKKFDREGRLVRKWGATGLRPDQFSFPRSLSFAKPDRLIIEDLANHRAQVCSTEGEWIGTYVAGGLATPIAIR